MHNATFILGSLPPAAGCYGRRDRGVNGLRKFVMTLFNFSHGHEETARLVQNPVVVPVVSTRRLAYDQLTGWLAD